MPHVLTLIKLQQEGKLQKGDTVNSSTHGDGKVSFVCDTHVHLRLNDGSFIRFSHDVFGVGGVLPEVRKV